MIKETKSHSGVAIAASRPFVGRARERALLIAGLQRSIAGQGQLFLISGEPGIGKTALADQIDAKARSTGIAALWGRCWEGGGAPPFWPWVQAIRSMVEAHDRASVKAWIDELGLVSRLIPELSKEPALTANSNRTHNPDDNERDRFLLFNSISTFLRSAANSKPFLIILEDFHAADEPSLLLLDFIARELRTFPLMLVVTYRETEVRLSPTLTQAFNQLAREGTLMPIEGLDDVSVRGLLEANLGRCPEDAEVATFLATTLGNPFFISELCRASISQAGVSAAPRKSVSDFKVPDGVRAVIRQRLSLVSPATLDFLRIASLIGREFDFKILGRISALPPASVLESVDEAAALGIIEEVTGAAEHYRFGHVLVAETLYADIPAKRRRELHLLVAQTLEDHHAASLETHLSELAHHYGRALPEGDPARAISFATKAAHHALDALAFEEAARLFQVALRAVDLQRPSNLLLRSELLLGLSNSQRSMGDFASSRSNAEEAIRLAKTLRDPVLQARAAILLAARTTAFGRVDRAIVSVLEDALAALGERNVSLASRLMSRLAQELYWSSDTDQGATLSRRAVELATEAGDPDAILRALNAKYYALWGPNTANERLEALNLLLRTASENRNGSYTERARYFLIGELIESGDIVGADQQIEEHARLVAELRQQNFGFTEVARAMRALIDGRFEESEQLASRALSLVNQQDPLSLQIYVSQIAMVRREQGRLGELEPMIRSFVVTYPTLIFAKCGIAYCYSEMGRRAEAANEFEHLAIDSFGTLRHDATWLASVALLAEVCGFLRDRKRAALLHSCLLPFAERFVMLASHVCYGSASLYLGVLDLAQGHVDEAIEHLQNALQMHTRSRMHPWMAHTQFRLAEALLTRGAPGDREKAEEMIALASAIAEACSMSALAERLRQLPSQIEQVRAAPDDQTDKVAARCMIRREGDFWTISYEGKLLRLSHAKGLSCLAFLLENQGREFSATDLAAASEDPAGGLLFQASSASTIATLVDTSPTLGDAGEMLDSSAKADYRQALKDMRAELDEAEGFNDSGRAEKIREEIDFIENELSRAVGLGGRDRHAASHSERARIRVTKQIKSATGRITKAHPSLGSHLDATLKTGLFCSYRPGEPVRWEK